MLGRTVLISLLFAAFALVGRTADKVKYEQTTPILHSLFNVRSLFVFLILSIIFYIIITIFEFFSLKFSLVSNKSHRISTKAIFFICFAIITVCYIPYFISDYPAVVTSDSNLILRQAFGADELYNHHPVLYTLFVMGLCRLGRLIFGSNNAGVALTALVQMIGMAATFAFAVTFLVKRKINKVYAALVLAFFALFPMNAHFAVTITKDIPFAALMLLLVLSLISLVEKRDKPTAGKMLVPALLTFLVSLLRNNALYIMPLLLVFLVISFKGKRLAVLCSFGTPIVAVALITGVLFPALNIKKSESTEYIAVPLQQVGRIVCACDVDEKDLAAVNDFLPIEFIEEKYNPTIVDTLKFKTGTRFGPTYDTEYFDQNKLSLAKLWARLCIKHPLTAADAYLCLTLGYWYPENYYGPASLGVVEGAADIEVYKADTEISLLDRAVSAVYETPVINRIWNVGLWMWLLILFSVIAGKKNGARALLPFVPVFGLVLTLLAATPIFAEKRYMYAVLVTLPVLFAIKDIPLNPEKENTK